MFDHALSLLGVYCLVIHPICKFLQQTAKKILAYPTVNRQKNSTGVSARFSNYGLYLYLYLWRIACQCALVSIVVEPTSPSLSDSKSRHTSVFTESTGLEPDCLVEYEAEMTNLQNTDFAFSFSEGRVRGWRRSGSPLRRLQGGGPQGRPGRLRQW